MTEKIYTIEGIKQLEKMGREGAEKASESLSKIINQEIRVSTVVVRSAPLEKIAESIGKSEDLVVAILMELGGEVNGQVIMIYPQQSALNVADFLSNRTLGRTGSLSELDKSALKESGNIIAGSFLAALSNYLSINMVESVPDIANDMLRAVVESAITRFAGKEASEAIAFEINFGMGTTSEGAAKVVPSIRTNAYFILLLDVKSAENLVGSLKKISGGKKMVK